jgi:hypothetical protein
MSEKNVDQLLVAKWQGGKMALRDLIVGILLLLIGIAFCFAGYRFFRVLVAIWGFFIGFVLGVQLTALYAHHPSTAVLLIAGLIVGIILAILAYYLYVAAIVTLSASVGYWIGDGIMAALGFASHSTAALLVGLIVAVILAVLTLALNLAKYFIVVITALGGASTIIAGILLLLGIVPLHDATLAYMQAIFHRSPIWALILLVLAVVGVIVQLSSTLNYKNNYAQSQF